MIINDLAPTDLIMPASCDSGIPEELASVFLSVLETAIETLVSEQENRNQNDVQPKDLDLEKAMVLQVAQTVVPVISRPIEQVAKPEILTRTIPIAADDKSARPVLGMKSISDVPAAPQPADTVPHTGTVPAVAVSHTVPHTGTVPVVPVPHPVPHTRTVPAVPVPHTVSHTGIVPAVPVPHTVSHTGTVPIDHDPHTRTVPIESPIESVPIVLVPHTGTVPVETTAPIEAAPVLADAAGITRQIVEKAEISWQDDNQVIEIKLKPDEFGDLRIRLVKSDEGLTARITASDERTCRMLTSQSAQLQEALQSKGLQIQVIDITAQTSNPDAFAGNQPRQGRAEEDSRSGRRSNDTRRRTPPGIAAPETLGQNVAGRGRIDYLA